MKISPSLLTADRSNLSLEAMKMGKAGAKSIHIDVMDGVFVPAYTWDHGVVKELREGTNGMALDTHLMVVDPLSQLDAYLDAGSDILTVHLEAFEDEESAKRCLGYIRKRGVKSGVSIKPKTKAEALLPLLGEFDQVIIMSVEPGRGGQSFMPSALEKISLLSKWKKEKGLDFDIEVDGGINLETGSKCKEMGADILVAGSYLFGHDDYRERLKGLLEL